MTGKVYSCSMFFDELDLLELKLETLNSLVDYFVISESPITFSGKEKPLWFLENRERFKKFEDKIIHQVVTDTPNSYLYIDEDDTKDKHYNLVAQRVNESKWLNHYESHWGRETFQKESLIRPLTNLENHDIILLSDLDEIVRPESLKEVLDDFDYGQLYHFQHDVFYYYLNLQKDEPWIGTIALTFENFLINSFGAMRTYRFGKYIDKGGWHFSFQNGAKAVKRKIESWGHQEFNIDSVKDNLENSIENANLIGKDLFGRNSKFTVRDVNDGTFPQYLVDHQDDIFKSYIRR